MTYSIELLYEAAWIIAIQVIYVLYNTINNLDSKLLKGINKLYGVKLSTTIKIYISAFDAKL